MGGDEWKKVNGRRWMEEGGWEEMDERRWVVRSG